MKALATQVSALSPTASNPALATFIQRACACGGQGRASGECEECEAERRFGAQAKLSVSEPGDSQEEEADVLAREVMRVPSMSAPEIHHSVTPLVQRQGEVEPVFDEEEKEEEEGQAKHIQRKQDDTALDEEEEEGIAAGRMPLQRSMGRLGRMSGPDFRRKLKQERSSGEPLSTDMRSFMESRFGVDFGHVRVHRGGRAAELSRDVHAQAFTLGHHVYFGSGYYQPYSASGRHLLAHELVHTIQQNGGAAPSSTARTEPVVQRQSDAFCTSPVPHGELVHALVLPKIGKSNRGLFTEVKIPGAKEGAREEHFAGVADFYKVTDGPETTLATLMVDGTPQYLESRAKPVPGQNLRSVLLKEGERFEHSKKGAPSGAQPGNRCEEGVDVCRLDAAPKTILLGDLKPPSPLKFLLGKKQLEDYRAGIDITRNGLNKYIEQHPERARPHGLKWMPNTGILKNLEIPEAYTFKGGESKELILYSERANPKKRGIRGPLVVYKQSDGIWAYEWVPKVYPPEMRRPAPKTLAAARNRIEVLITQLKSPMKGAVAKKALRGPRRAVPSKKSFVMQRRPEFNAVTWNGDYEDWRNKVATPFLGSKEVGLLPGGKGAVPESEEARISRIAAVAVDARQRTGLQIPLPQSVEARGQAYKLIRRWARWGSLFGRMRASFGGLFLKISSLFDKAGEKFEELRQKRGEPKASGGSIGKAIIRSALKVAFAFFKVLLKRVTQQLKRSLQRAATALVESFFSEESLDRIEEAKRDFEELAGKVKAELEANVDERVKALIEPYDKTFAMIEGYVGSLSAITRLVNAVKWGLRIVQCVTPPGLGCLKLIVQAVVEELAARVTATCWFQLNFIKPLLSSVRVFTALPGTITKFILDQVKNIATALPFSKETIDRAFPAPTIDTNVTARDLECDASRITKAQREMNKLLEKYGLKRLREMIKLLEEGGLTEDREMTVADVHLLRDLLEKIDSGRISEEELTDAIADLREGKPTGVKGIDEFLDRLGIGPGKLGPSGAEGKGRDVKVAPFDRAKYRGAGPIGRYSRSRILVLNSDPTHAKGSRQTVSLGLFIDGRHVMTVTEVPAHVVEFEDSAKLGKTHRRVIYRLDSPVEFRTGIEGVAEAIVASEKRQVGRPFVVEGEPLGAGVP